MGFHVINAAMGFDREMTDAFRRGEFSSVVMRAKGCMKRHPESPGDIISTGQSYFLQSSVFQFLPHLDLFKQFALHVDPDVFLQLSDLFKVLESPAFEIDGQSTSWLVFANVSKIKKASQKYLEWIYQSVSPINLRSPLPSMMNRSRSKYRLAEKIYRGIVKGKIETNNLVRISERAGAHFADAKIKKLMVTLEKYLSQSLKKGLMGIQKRNAFNYKAECELEDMFSPLYKTMKRYQVVADVINWRVRLDALAIDGGERIPVIYNGNDVKKAVNS